MTEEAEQAAAIEVPMATTKAEDVSPSSLHAPASVGGQQKTPAEPKKLFGIALPQWTSRVSESFSERIGRMRIATVKFLPAAIVNNSSNIIGAAHVGTEMIMFKASVKGGTLVQNPKNPINWVVQPIATVFRETFEGMKSKDLSTKELFEGNPLKNFRTRIVDMKGATQREYARQMAEGIPHAKVSLPNRWQSRSTFFGLVAWTLSALIPEKKETPEEIEDMAILRATHPVQYVGERLKQAVWVPEWSKHKRQMIGLAYMLIGVCSSIGSWRGRTNGMVNGLKGAEYSFNGHYLATSSLSFLASVPLLFSLDEKSGYGGFGAIMMGRIPFLFGSINTKFKNSKKNGGTGDVDGARWYTFAMVSFQLENLMQGLFGGAQKVKETLPDGTVVERIIDHQAVRKEAKERAREIKQQARAEREQRNHGGDRPSLVEGEDTPLVVTEDGALKAAPHDSGAALSATEDASLAVNKDGQLVKQDAGQVAAKKEEHVRTDSPIPHLGVGKREVNRISPEHLEHGLSTVSPN